MKSLVTAALLATSVSLCAQQTAPAKQLILHADRMLDVAAGRILTPGEVLVENGRIREVGPHVTHPAGVLVRELGNTTLMPGLIDAHTHLFLHVGNEANQTIDESVPQRTLIAAGAAKADLLAGFTAERDMERRARDAPMSPCATPLMRVIFPGLACVFPAMQSTSPAAMKTTAAATPTSTC